MAAIDGEQAFSTVGTETAPLVSTIFGDAPRVAYADGFDDGVAAAGPPPIITILSPTPGVGPGQPGGFSADWSIARVTPVVIDIDGEDLSFACLVVRYPTDAGIVERVVYRRGALRPGFADGSNTEQVSTTKLRLSVLPDGGWPSFGSVAAIVFDIDAVAGGALSDAGASS